MHLCIASISTDIDNVQTEAPICTALHPFCHILACNFRMKSHGKFTFHIQLGMYNLWRCQMVKNQGHEASKLTPKIHKILTKYGCHYDEVTYHDGHQSHMSACLIKNQCYVLSIPWWHALYHQPYKHGRHWPLCRCWYSRWLQQTVACWSSWTASCVYEHPSLAQ